jgi:hypothetical protein
MSIEVVGVAGAVALAVFGVLLTLAVRYAKKSERERIQRWLAERAQGVSDAVVDELSQAPVGDAEFLDSIRPDGVPESRR